MDTHGLAFSGIGRALLTAAVLATMEIKNFERKITQMRISVKLLVSTIMLFTVLAAGHRLAYGQYTNSQPVAQPAFDSDIDRYIDLVRKDVRSVKKQVIAANLDLTDDEAVKFWPIYDQYTAELAKINDTKIALIEDYAQNYTVMTDEQAEAYVKGRAAVEESVNRLRLKYFPLFRRVLSGKTTAKFFQIEWRISLMIDLELASQMPLIQQ
jgi:hypothetical protein